MKYGYVCFTLTCVHFWLTRCSVIDWSSTAGHDRCDHGRENPCSHVQQRLDDVTLEDGVLLPQVQDSHYLTLETSIKMTKSNCDITVKCKHYDRCILKKYWYDRRRLPDSQGQKLHIYYDTDTLGFWLSESCIFSCHKCENVSWISFFFFLTMSHICPW